MKVAILEVGSTNTRVTVWEDETLVSSLQKVIPLKSHYRKNDTLFQSDLDMLYSLLADVRKNVDSIFVFGTSIFRTMAEEERKGIQETMGDLYQAELRVVTSEEEMNYTVKGCLRKIGHLDRVAVVVGGGGSTELAIVERGVIVRKELFPFGAIDITEQFPDLKEDVATTSFDAALAFTLEKVNHFVDHVDILILAGGDYIHFYETCGYQMEENKLYEDENQPWLLTLEEMDTYDRDVFSISLDCVRQKDLGNEAWWDGVRGMRCCMSAIAKQVGAQYIIPTKINMVNGLLEDVLMVRN